MRVIGNTLTTMQEEFAHLYAGVYKYFHASFPLIKRVSVLTI